MKNKIKKFHCFSIKKLKNFGILNRMGEKLFSKRNYQFLPTTNKANLTIWDIALLLEIIFSGIFLSVLILFIENVYNFYRMKIVKINKNKTKILFKPTNRLMRHMKS